MSTLVLHAMDDPVVAFDGVDWKAAIDNRHIISAWTKRGGHVTFPQGATPFGRSFSDDLVSRYFSGVLELTASTRFAAEVVIASLEAKREEDGAGSYPSGGRESTDALGAAMAAATLHSPRRRSLSLSQIARVSSRTALPLWDRSRRPSEEALTF